ncbi:hypothetical protein [Thermaerobacter subterraneus]|uniref:hypothetical protein n=1 Tax=Thermaerobacter subterraneus TaxID=175696 RepID=UPI001FA6E3BA|nr:hypothetical protein [Thermaerobacter subterraneus]
MAKVRRVVATVLVAVGSMVLAGVGSASRASEPWWFDLPPGEKREMAAREDVYRRSSPPAPKDQVGAREAVQQGDPARPAGIIESGEYPDPTVVIQNRWQGPAGDGHMAVFAGAYRDRPEQGLVIVHWYDDQWRFVRGRPVESPRAQGSLRITGAGDGVLILRAGSGDELRFDLATATFVD